MKYLYSLLLIVSTIILRAQTFYPGYIVKHSGDTLYGEISLRANELNSKSCIFKTDQKDTEFNAGEIYGYIVDGRKYYTSATVVINNIKKTVFLEYLLKGIANLYYHYEDGGEFYFYERDGEFLQLKNDIKEVEIEDKVYEAESNEYKSTLKYMFRDYTDVFPKIESASLNHKSLITVFKDYHNATCDEFECVDYTKATKIKKDFEVFAGWSASHMSLKTSSETSTYMAPTAGFKMILHPVKLHESWSFFTGLGVSRFSFQQEFHNELLRPYRHKVDLSHLMINIPIGVRFTTNGKLQFYADAALGINRSLSITQNVIAVTYYDIHNDYIETHFATPLRRILVGPSVGIGVAKKLNGSKKLFVELGYDLRTPPTKGGWLLDYYIIQSGLIKAGFSF
ncbi:MAG: hypothetical protein JXQ90_02340 [Cyclobacteriaceae bacterium]